MAKGHNDSGNENDYIEQLQWQATHRRRASVRFEPKWKYKIKYKLPEATTTGKIIYILLIGGGLYALLTFVSSFLSNPNVDLQGKVFFFIVVSLIVVIIFLAIRDGSKDNIPK